MEVKTQLQHLAQSTFEIEFAGTAALTMLASTSQQGA
jgi:hypothetical protein